MPNFITEHSVWHAPLIALDDENYDENVDREVFSDSSSDSSAFGSYDSKGEDYFTGRHSWVWTLTPGTAP